MIWLFKGINRPDKTNKINRPDKTNKINMIFISAYLSLL